MLTILSGLSVVFMAFVPLCKAQPIVWVHDISVTGVNVRGGTVVVGQVAIDVPTSGTVILNFDGQCTGSIGDRIVLAASSTKNWTSNDGNVGVEPVGNDYAISCFSHTRAYHVNAGQDTFYAVVQNYVNTGGSGVASVYGTLTATFFSNLPGQPFGASQGIVLPNANLSGTPVKVASRILTTNQSGFALVRFDGLCIPDTGDIILLDVSNTDSWSPDLGTLLTALPGYNGNTGLSFSRSRVFPVTAGSDTFFAVAEQGSGSKGTGVAVIYGSLTVEFFPEPNDSSLVEDHPILKENLELRGAPVTVGKVGFVAPAPGKAIVRFDGYCVSSVGDLIVLAASDTTDWVANDGNVAVEAASSTYDVNPFTHTRVYNVPAGADTFYAVAQNYVSTSGTGRASIGGDLSVEYFPTVATAIKDVSEVPEAFRLFQNYPNPFNPTTAIGYQLSANSYVTLKVYDILGRRVATLVNKRQNPGSYAVRFDGSRLAGGVYFYRLMVGSLVKVKKLVLIK